VAFFTAPVSKPSVSQHQISALSHAPFWRARLARLTIAPVCYVPREFWIALITEVTHRIPKIHGPLVFLLH
jgi:hypothetical protein